MFLVSVCGRLDPEPSSSSRSTTAALTRSSHWVLSLLPQASNHSAASPADTHPHRHPALYLEDTASLC